MSDSLVAVRVRRTLAKRRGHAAAAGLAISAALAVAACGSSSAGNGANAPGVSGKKVTIGLNLATSGPYAILGQTAAGVDAYFRQLNAKGGVNGYTFKTVTGDNQDQSAQAASVARQQADTTFTALGVADGILNGVGPIAKQTKEPVMVGANGSLLIPVQQYAYGLLPVYANESVFDANYIFDKLHTKNFAFVYTNDDYGQPAQATVPKYVSSHGGKLLADVPVSPTQTDFSSTAARLKASGAKVVMTWSDIIGQPQIQKAAAAIGYDPVWVSGFGLLSPSYTSVAGGLAKGVYVDDFQYPLSLKNPEVELYSSVMQKDSPKNVQSTFAQQGWTFAAIVADAVKQATAGGKPLTRAAYMQALEHPPSGPVGLLSSVGFSSSKHYAAGTGAMFKWTGTTWAQVSPFSAYPSP